MASAFRLLRKPLENISAKVLVFMDPETKVTKPYTTRFNSPEYVKHLLAR